MASALDEFAAERVFVLSSSIVAQFGSDFCVVAVITTHEAIVLPVHASEDIVHALAADVSPE